MNRPQSLRAFLACPGLMLAVLLASGCASTPPAHSTRDPQANFSAFSTFAWDNGQQAGTPAQPLSILDSNIRTAIGEELQRKGYVEVAAGASPSLFLHYETAAAEKIKSNPFRLGIGVGGYGSSGGASVGMSTPAARDVREGTLVLRAVDPMRNAEVWNGRVSRELSRDGPPDPVLIKNAVGELLQKFPVREGKPQ